MENICIIGLGLLGGSFGKAIRKIYPAARIAGVDISEAHATTALKIGIVDEVTTFEKGVATADLVMLATPVDAIASQVGHVLDLISENAVVIDLGSTKENIVTQADKSAARGSFVAAHPIAGTENSGPGAALPQLFEGKMIIVCNREDSDESKLNLAVGLFEKMGMQVKFMDAAAHDQHIAYVSHLSHISSFGLGATVLEKEKNEQNIFIMAGSGFDSTVRLAKSSPDMWTPIFEQNRSNVSQALGGYIEKLSQFKQLLDEGRTEELHRFMSETNDIRRVLKGPDRDS